jgi:hypothetical protein
MQGVEMGSTHNNAATALSYSFSLKGDLIDLLNAVYANYKRCN